MQQTTVALSPSEEARRTLLELEKCVLQVDTATIALSKQKAENEELRSHLASSYREKEDLAVALQRSQSQLSDLEGKVQQIAVLQARNGKLQDQNRANEETIESLRMVIETHERQNDDMERIIAEFRRVCGDLKQQARKLEEESSQQNKEKDHDREVNNDRSRIALMSREKEDVSSRVAAAQKQDRSDVAGVETEDAKLRPDLLAQSGHRHADEEVQKSMMKTEESNEMARQLALENDRLKLELENQRRTLARESDCLKEQVTQLTQQLMELQQQRELSELEKPGPQ
jgi:hypothetical protein